MNESRSKTPWADGVAAFSTMAAISYPGLALLWRYGLWPLLLNGAWQLPPVGLPHQLAQAAEILSFWGLPVLAYCWRRQVVRAQAAPKHPWLAYPFGAVTSAAALVATAWFVRAVWQVSAPAGIAVAVMDALWAIPFLRRRPTDPLAWVNLTLFSVAAWVAAVDVPTALVRSNPQLWTMTSDLVPALFIDAGVLLLAVPEFFLFGTHREASPAGRAVGGADADQQQAPPAQTAPERATMPGPKPLERRRPNPHAFDHLVGLGSVIDKLKDAIELPLREPERLARYNVKPAAAFLLAGPPGTGKTALARAAADYFGCAFFAVGPADLVAGTGLVGSAEGRLKQLFADARKLKPAIIFLDEIDAIAAKRDGSALNRPQDLLLRPLLAELDGFEPLEGVLVLAATNVPELLDPALIRSGRFGAPIWVSPPGRPARAAMFRVYLAGRPLAADVDVDELAERSEGWVGADIESAVAAAAMVALKRGMQEPTRDRIEMADLRAQLPLEIPHRLTDRRGQPA